MFLTRCKDRSVKNNLYFTSRLVRNLVSNNVDRGVKIINTGVKAFAKCENKGAECTYRLAQEGAQMTIPFMGTKRIVRPTRADMQVLLLKNDIELPPDIDEMEEATREQLHALPTGSIALVYQEMRGKQAKLLPKENGMHTFSTFSTTYYQSSMSSIT